MTESRSMIANSMISFPLPKMETHSVYTLLCLASFPQHNYFEIHSCCCWVGIHHNLFIHLCVDGYIITNLLLFWKNFCKHFCINLFVECIFLSFGQIYRSRITESWHKCLFYFTRNFYQNFSKVVVPFYSGTSKAGELQLLHILTPLVCPGFSVSAIQMDMKSEF